MDAERVIAEIELLERIFAAPDTRPMSARDLSAVNPERGVELNPDYDTVKVLPHGCPSSNPSDRDDSCWVEMRLLDVKYCAGGAAPMAGLSRPASVMATSMGSGRGCRQ